MQQTHAGPVEPLEHMARADVHNGLGIRWGVCSSLPDIPMVPEHDHMARWQPWSCQRLCSAAGCNELEVILAINGLCVEPAFWP